MNSTKTNRNQETRKMSVDENPSKVSIASKGEV